MSSATNEKVNGNGAASSKEASIDIEKKDNEDHLIEDATESLAAQIDPLAEKRLLRKLDWVFMPMFTAICERSHRLS